MQKRADDFDRQRTIRMLTAVGRANERVEALGLAGSVAVVYTLGHARLLSYANRREMLVVKGPPARACGILSGILELSLKRLLNKTDPA